MQPELITGGSFTDERGSLFFLNEFSFPDVKRFYRIDHPNTAVVRAWQGHKVEHKYFYVAKGSFVIGWVKIDDWETPADNLVADHTVLTADRSCILSVPPGYANGIKALEQNAALIIFSNLSAEASANDMWRFEPSRWLNWQQF